MKMVSLEAEGEFGIQGSIGLEFRLWNGDLLAFGGEGALWYGMALETGISMSDESLMLTKPDISVYPKLSASLFVESYVINNRKHRFEATVELTLEDFKIRLLPEIKHEEEKTEGKLIIKPTIEPISMIEVSEQGFALFSNKSPDTPVTHQPLPASTIIDEIPTAPYKDIQLEPAELTFTLPAETEEEYFVKPYVIADGKCYYGEGEDDRWVDLGLPSGILWAAYNLGATSPEEYGGYYAWGETEEKSSYSMSNYNLYDLNIDISGTSYDVATQKWGGGARIPSLKDFKELLSNCSWYDSFYNGIRGYYADGPNGNKIFFPLTGYKMHESARDKNYAGYFWSSTPNGDLAYILEIFSEEGLDETDYFYCDVDKDYGMTIRPVKDMH